jgi:hypothetical protein
MSANGDSGFPAWLVKPLEDELTRTEIGGAAALASRFEDLRVDLFPEGGRDRLRAVIAYFKSGGWVASEAVNAQDAKPIHDALHRLAQKVAEKTGPGQLAAEQAS